MKPALLILGGTGFLSGALAQLALERNWDVTIVTRGTRAVPEGVRSLNADRTDRRRFAEAFHDDERIYDLVVDCICYQRENAEQDIVVFAGKARHFVMVSTDFVYDPLTRATPQGEENAQYVADGYGGRKRQAEEVFQAVNGGSLPWTILRPGHICGPGSLLGCLPLHSRDPGLVKLIRAHAPLRLVDEGSFLQHPVYVVDLAKTILSVADVPDVAGQILNVAGPDIVTSRRYYRILASILGCPLVIEGVGLQDYLASDPDKIIYCTDRSYDLRRLHASGLSIPETSLPEALAAQVAALEA